MLEINVKLQYSRQGLTGLDSKLIAANPEKKSPKNTETTRRLRTLFKIESLAARVHFFF